MNMEIDPAKRLRTIRERLQAPVYDNTGSKTSTAPEFWWKASGPILTIFLFFVVAVLALTGMRDDPPASLILIAVAFSAFTGGLGLGLISSFLSILAFFSIIIISDMPQNNFLDFQQAIVLSVVSFSISILLGLLRQHDDRTTRKLRASEKRFRSMFESIQDIYFRTDLQGWIQIISPSVKNELGYEPVEVIGQQFASMSVREVDGKEIFRLLNSSEQVLDHEVEFKTKDNKTVFLSVSAQKIFDDEDNPIAIEGSARNTTARKLAEDSLIHELKYEKAISGISAAFVAPDNFDTALDGALANIAQLSKASRCYLFLLSDDKILISNTSEWVLPGGSAKKPSFQNVSAKGFAWALTELAKGGQIKIDDVSETAKEEQLVVAELKRDDVGSLLLTPVNAGEELVGFIGIDMVGQKTFIPDQACILLKIGADIIGDAVHRYRNESVADNTTYYDKQTNLPNRRLLNDRMNQALAIMKRRREMLALLYIGLSPLQVLADEQDPDVNLNDMFLKSISKLLIERLRTQDTVARIDSDEFVLVLVGIRSEEDAHLVAEKLLDSITTPNVLSGHKVRIDANIGISVFPKDGEVAEFLVRKASIAMHQAKREAGGNTVAFFQEQTKQSDEAA